MRFTSFALFSIVSLISYAQNDYRKMKDTICPQFIACGIRDSVTLNEIYPKLLSLDTNSISKGMAEYYADLAMIQNDFYMSSSDTSFLRLSAVSYERSLINCPKDTRILWNTALAFALLGECERAHLHMAKYIKYCKKKNWKREQLGFFLVRCSNEDLKRKLAFK